MTLEKCAKCGIRRRKYEYDGWVWDGHRMDIAFCPKCAPEVKTK